MNKRVFDGLSTEILAFFLPLDLNENISSSWGLGPLAFELEIQQWLSRFSDLYTKTETKPLALLSLQLADSPCRYEIYQPS